MAIHGQAGIQFATDSSGTTSGVFAPDGLFIPNKNQAGGMKYAGTAGKLVADFSEAVTPWSITSGTPTLVRDYTGYDGSGNVTGVTSRTGLPKMLKWTVASAGEAIQLPVGSLNITLNGKLGIWVYVENQTGYGPSETFPYVGSLNILLTNSATGFGQSLSVAWNTNQLREGWNFLKFVAATADCGVGESSSGLTIDQPHPLGMVVGYYGSGTTANIVGQNLRSIQILANNIQIGTTIYLDSIWTGFTSKAVFVPMIDQMTSDSVSTVLPMAKAKGWKLTAMAPRQIWASGQIVGGTFYGDMTNVQSPYAAALYTAGWDIINHTITHRPMQPITSDSEIRYEIEMAKGWNRAQGFLRGSEFYASPQSSTSRLSEKVIAASGMKLQRHARKYNVSITPWGIDNPNHLGAVDLGNQTTAQSATKIKKCIDTICRYGDAFFPFWHTCRTLGDDGTGELIYVNDNLNIYQSNLQQVFDYMALKVAQGQAYGVIPVSQFWYGDF